MDTKTESPPTITAPLHVQFDGSLRRPDEAEPSAAIGYQLTDARCRTITEESQCLAYWRSNTHIEYDALIAALKHAAALEYSGHIIVHGDAESVLRVVNPDETSTANDGITQRYAEKTQELLHQFASYSFDNMPRDSNEKADSLADAGHAEDPIPL